MHEIVIYNPSACNDTYYRRSSTIGWCLHGSNALQSGHVKNKHHAHRRRQPPPSGSCLVAFGDVEEAVTYLWMRNKSQNQKNKKGNLQLTSLNAFHFIHKCRFYAKNKYLRNLFKNVALHIQLCMHLYKSEDTRHNLRDICVWIYKTHLWIVSYLWIMLRAFVNNIETNLSPYVLIPLAYPVQSTVKLHSSVKRLPRFLLAQLQ